MGVGWAGYAVLQEGKGYNWEELGKGGGIKSKFIL